MLPAKFQYKYGCHKSELLSKVAYITRTSILSLSTMAKIGWRPVRRSIVTGASDCHGDGDSDAANISVRVDFNATEYLPGTPESGVGSG